MKLEFLDDISDGGRFKNVVTDQLIRLYDFSHLEAGKLQKEVREVIVESRKPLSVIGLDFIQPLNCSLIFRISEQQGGIVTNNNVDFFCDLTIKEYEQMVNFIGVFCEEGEVHGYQWLYDPVESDIELLLSPGGTW